MSKFLRLMIVFSLLAGALGLMGRASAATVTERQRQIEAEKATLRSKIQDAERRAKLLAGQIQASDTRRTKLEAAIADYGRQLAEAEANLAKTEGSLALARDGLIVLEGNLTTTLVRLDEMKSSLNSRARQTYKEGPSAYLRWIFAADSLREFVHRAAFLKGVMQDSELRIKAVERLTEQMDLARGEAVENKVDIEHEMAEIEAHRTTVAELRTALQGTRQAVIAEIGTRRVLLGQVQAEKAEYLRQMKQLDAESRSIAAMLRSRQRGQVWQAGSGKTLAWPTTGSVSSGFGWRTHPIFGDKRFHNGIDISAPFGQPVIAAEAGQVVSAGYKGGYGLTIVIDHGSALATLYAHLSATNISAGSRVSRGQRIGAVGCTGYCTGAHLHFETRINGEPRDPMLFF